MLFFLLVAVVAAKRDAAGEAAEMQIKAQEQLRVFVNPSTRAVCQARRDLANRCGGGGCTCLSQNWAISCFSNGTVQSRSVTYTNVSCCTSEYDSVTCNNGFMTGDNFCSCPGSSCCPVAYTYYNCLYTSTKCGQTCTTAYQYVCNAAGNVTGWYTTTTCQPSGSVTSNGFMPNPTPGPPDASLGQSCPSTTTSTTQAPTTTPSGGCKREAGSRSTTCVRTGDASEARDHARDLPGGSDSQVPDPRRPKPRDGPNGGGGTPGPVPVPSPSAPLLRKAESILRFGNSCSCIGGRSTTCSILACSACAGHPSGTTCYTGTCPSAVWNTC